MKIRKTRKILASTLVIAIFAISTFSIVPRVAAATPSLTISPPTVISGKSITVTGIGFPATVNGIVWIDANGNGKLDTVELTFAAIVYTSTTGTFTANLATFDLAMGAYNVNARVPAEGPVVASAQVTIQDASVNAIQSAQSALSTQISNVQTSLSQQITQISTSQSSLANLITGGLTALSNQISNVQSDLDQRIGSGHPGDSVFSLLYGISTSVASIQTSISSLANTLSNIQSTLANIMGAIASLSGQVSNLQIDLDSRLAAIQGSLNAIEVSQVSLSTQVTAVQTSLSTMQGQVSVIQDGVFAIRSDTSTLIVSLANFQSELDRKIGSANTPTETIFSDLQGIGSELPAVQSDIDSRIGAPGQPIGTSTLFGLIGKTDADVFGVQQVTLSIQNTLGVFHTSDTVASLLYDIQSRTALVQNNLGSPRPSTSDTIFGLLYQIQQNVSTGQNAIINQIIVVQADLDSKLGTPATSNETVFGDFFRVTITLNSLVSLLQGTLGTPQHFGDSVLSLEYGLQTSVNSLQTSLNGLGSQLSSVQTDLDNKLGTPTGSSDTVFSLLYNIQSSLSTISTLQASITNLQNTINSLQTTLSHLSNTATVTSGGGQTLAICDLSNGTCSASPTRVYANFNHKIATVTVTVNATIPATSVAGVIVRYYTDPFVDANGNTFGHDFIHVDKVAVDGSNHFGFTDTAAAWKVELIFQAANIGSVCSFAGGVCTFPITVTWAYSSVNPAS